MYPVAAETLAALSNNHEMAVVVNVFTRQGVRAADIPIHSGTITATILSDVCRSGSITVSQRLTDAGLLDPARDRVQIFTGARGFPLIPIFIGRVTDRSRPAGGLVQVQLADYGKDIVDARFEQPWQANTTLPVPLEMRRIIKDVDSVFSVDVDRVPWRSTPNVVWEEDRAGALDQLAAGTNSIWQSDRVGGFTIYTNPYSLTSVPSPVHAFSTGPEGTLTGFTENTTRDNVFNSVTVLVERPNNVPPIRVTVRETDPGSPFRWGGEYGKVNRIVRLQTPGGVAEATLLARRLLSQSLSLFRSWRLATPHFPVLDPGDIISVTEQETTIQVVESITYPLQAINESTFATRELRNYIEVT